MNKFPVFICIFAILLCFCGIKPVLAEENQLAQGNENILPYDYSDTTSVPIYVSITDEVSTKNHPVEGGKLQFKVNKDVYYNNEKILSKGEIISGRIETIITSGMNGFPAEIILDDFEIPNIKNSQLLGKYVKKGQNRCFWVYPLKWALTIIPFVGSTTNFIKGGHARIKTTDIITILYYPNWR